MPSPSRFHLPVAALAALFIALATFAPHAAATQNAGGATECTRADRNGVQRCRTGLPRKRMEELLRMQEQSQWCWAAGIAMLFASVGHEVHQEDVVRENFGELLNWPAPDREITRLLNRRWQDREGRAFVASADTSESGLDMHRDAPGLLAELKAGRPVMLAAMRHVVVLAEVEFERSTRSDDVRIVGGTVLDPAVGRGIRPMADHELKPAYVARIRIDRAETVEARVTRYRGLVLR